MTMNICFKIQMVLNDASYKMQKPKYHKVQPLDTC